MADARSLAALEKELEQLKRQLPAHSISPSILARIDDLEEEIARLTQSENVQEKDSLP